LEKSHFRPFRSSAPTLITQGKAAGQNSALFESLPAAATTSTGFSSSSVGLNFV
jgi:hypothetical protein